MPGKAKLESKRRRDAVPIWVTLSLMASVAPPALASSGLRLEPVRVDIGAFFAGVGVHVFGEIPAGADAIVEVFGKRIEEQLLRKGRHWDIWMNVGEIDVQNAPCLYYAMSTDPASLSAAGPHAEFGYGALKERLTFTGDTRGMSQAEIFQRFVQLKESEKLYRLIPGSLTVSASLRGRATIEGTFWIPSRVNPGSYQVRLSILDHGRVLRSQPTELRVQKVGLPAFLSSLAREHGALHGVLAVIIAVIFGFLVGVVFRRRKRTD
jgi:hypothetical protein